MNLSVERSATMREKNENPDIAAAIITGGASEMTRRSIRTDRIYPPWSGGAVFVVVARLRRLEGLDIQLAASLLVERARQASTWAVRRRALLARWRSPQPWLGCAKVPISRPSLAVNGNAITCRPRFTLILQTSPMAILSIPFERARAGPRRAGNARRAAAELMTLA